MKKLIAVIIITGVFLSSCVSNQTVMMDTVNDEDLQMLLDVELSLISYRLSNDPADMSDTGPILMQLEQKNTSNKEFHAKLLALKAEYILYTGVEEGDLIPQIADLLEEAKEINPQEEQIYIVHAFIETDKEIKTDWLLKAEKLRKAKRVFLELGNEYFSNNEYKKAVASYDECIKNSGEIYLGFIEKNREIAWAMINSDTETTDNSFLTREGDISLAEFTKIMYRETSLFDKVIDNPELPQTFEKMDAQGLIAYPNVAWDGTILRKDAAYILAVLIAKKQNNPEQLIETSRYYREMGWTSPIPDLYVSDKYFPAGVMMVEYGIMELPDGEKFYPTDPLDAKEIMAIITQINKLFH